MASLGMAEGKGGGFRWGGLQKCDTKWYMGFLEERKCMIKICCYGMHDVIPVSIFPTKLL